MALRDYLKDTEDKNTLFSPLLRASALNGVEVRRNPYLISAFYLILVTIAEWMTVYHPKWGIVSHAFIMVILFCHFALVSGKDEILAHYLIALLLAPLIRILSLCLPYIQFSWIFSFMLVSIPLFIAIFTCMWLQGLHGADVGFALPKLKYMPLEAGMILFAVALGIAEYMILRPNPLPVSGKLNLIIASLLLTICTGFLEELAFRGLLQYNAVRVMSKWRGILIVSAIFGVLHLGNVSPWHLDCFFAGAVGLIFAVVRDKTGSLYGISFAHGIINITLFLIVPLYF
jgi:membrane protease YdiL (CAAX protease family)